MRTPFSRRRPFLVILIALIAAVVASCQQVPPQRAEEITVWHPLGSWSGHGVLQTEPFISDTGLLRLTWQAQNGGATGEGTLRISVNSDVSGRQLALPVDHRGDGADVAYVNEDPRSFYLLIDSAHLDWSVNVAEGVSARSIAR